MRTHRDKRELVTRNQQMLAMHRQEKTLREIAAAFQISIVRAYQIVTREKQRTIFDDVRLKVD